MKTPRVTLENYKAVYDYYQARTPSRTLSRLGFRAAALALEPRILYTGNSQQALADEIERDTAPLIVCNHLSYYDPVVIAGTAWRSPLQEQIGEARAIGKDPLFHNPIIRYVADSAGGIPVFRSKNYEGKSTREAADALIDTVAHAIAVRHQPVLITPEATINRGGDPSQLMKVHSGIGHMALRARELGGDPHIVPMAISYGPEEKRRHARVVIGEPITDLPDTVSGVVSVIQTALQHEVTHAHHTY